MVPPPSVPAPSDKQWFELLRLLSHDEEILHGNFTGPNGHIRVKRKWQTMATTLNCVEGGTANKTGEQWQKAWVGLRNRARAALRAKHVYMGQTGGGVSADLAGLGLSDLHQRILNLVGTTAAVGTSCPDPLSIQLQKAKQNCSQEEQDIQVAMCNSLQQPTQEWHDINRHKEEIPEINSLSLNDHPSQEEEYVQAAMCNSLQQPTQEWHDINRHKEEIPEIISLSLNDHPSQEEEHVQAASLASLQQSQEEDEQLQAAIEASLQVSEELENSMTGWLPFMPDWGNNPPKVSIDLTGDDPEDVCNSSDIIIEYIDLQSGVAALPLAPARTGKQLVKEESVEEISMDDLCVALKQSTLMMRELSRVLSECSIQKK